jgi:DNA (cytosine-5)-methyltransferase 1
MGGGFDVAHSLKAEGFDASEDGTGRGTPLVPTFAIQGAATRENPASGPGGVGVRSDGLAYTLEARAEVQYIAFSAKDHGADAQVDLSPTLRAGGHSGSHANAGVMPAIAFIQGENNGKLGNGTREGQGNLSEGAMRIVQQPEIRSASQGLGLDESFPNQFAEALPQLPHEGAQVEQEVPALQRPTQRAGVLREALPEVQKVGRPGEVGLAGKETVLCSELQCNESRSRTLQQTCTASETGNAWGDSENKKRVRQSPMAVRRLLPIECERLQGFPDAWTDVPYRGKPAADGPRYKALGNSMAVNVMRFIGERIQAVELRKEQEQAA